MITSHLIRTTWLALAGWFVLSVGVMWWTSAAPAARVMFPTTNLINALEPEMRILDHDAISITIASTLPDLSTKLYRSGATLVLPAGLTGCWPVPLSVAT